MSAVRLHASLSALALASMAVVAADPVAVVEQSLARTHRQTLGNGTVVLLLEDHSAPVVSVQVWIGTGSIDEQEYLGSGISHAIEHMIFKGTERRPVGAITREINDVGGKINAYTSFDRTVFHTDLPSRHWRVGLDILADAVYRASFPAEEWAKEREVILREIAMGNDDPGRILGHLLWETVFTVHPFRVPVIGHTDAFQMLTRDDLVRLARRRYVPDNLIVAVAGDIRIAEVSAALRESFGAEPRRARAPSVLPSEPVQTTPRFARRTGAFNVSRLEWAYPTVPLSHPDAAVLDVLAAVTGHGRSSRLTARLRERESVVHEIHASSYTPRETGIFGIGAVFDPAREPVVTNAIASEIASWATSGFTRDEVEKARRQTLAGAVAELQTMHGMADSIASGMFYAQDVAYSSVYLRRVHAVTPAALRDAVRRYLTPERLTLVILSPEAESAARAETTAAGRPLYRRERLAAGIPLIIREDHRMPMTHVCAVARGGLLSESEADNGITRLTSDLLTRGTARRTAAEIARTVESLGAGLSAFSGNNSFGLRAHCLATDLPVILDLVGECLAQPVFAPEEVERQRRIQLAAIAQEHERPMFAAQRALNASLFAHHPYRLSLNGTTGSVSRIERDAIAAFAARHLVAGNLVVSVFGDVPPDTSRLVERALRRVPPGQLPAAPLAAAAAPLPVRTVQAEPRQQAIVLAGFPGVRVGDPAADALSVLATAMSGLSSALSSEVREKRGLAYYVGAYQHLGLHPGSFVLYAGTKSDAVGDVERLFAAEVNRVTGTGITTAEFERARNQILADHEMDEQSNSELAMSCALNELYGLGFDYDLDLPRRLQTLTAEALREAAASVLSTNRMAVSVVVPAKP
jgi:zinc protease